MSHEVHMVNLIARALAHYKIVLFAPLLILIDHVSSGLPIVLGWVQ